jgi:hypothetical protein
VLAHAKNALPVKRVAVEFGIGWYPRYELTQPVIRSHPIENDITYNKIRNNFIKVSY